MSNYYIGLDMDGTPYIEHFGTNYLEHRNNKYLLKVGKGSDARYFYSQDAVDSYYGRNEIDVGTQRPSGRSIYKGTNQKPLYRRGVAFNQSPVASYKNRYGYTPHKELPKTAAELEKAAFYRSPRYNLQTEGLAKDAVGYAAKTLKEAGALRRAFDDQEHIDDVRRAASEKRMAEKELEGKLGSFERWKDAYNLENLLSKKPENHEPIALKQTGGYLYDASMTLANAAAALDEFRRKHMRKRKKKHGGKF